MLVQPKQGNPSPSSYQTRNDLFKNEIEKGKGHSFGMGRKEMQKIDQERDILYLKDNPSPNKYSPVHVGKELSKDSVKYTF